MLADPEDGQVPLGLQAGHVRLGHLHLGHLPVPEAVFASDQGPML
jgi:hypothetical protein